MLFFQCKCYVSTNYWVFHIYESLSFYKTYIFVKCMKRKAYKNSMYGQLIKNKQHFTETFLNELKHKIIVWTGRRNKKVPNDLNQKTNDQIYGFTPESHDHSHHIVLKLIFYIKAFHKISYLNKYLSVNT